MAVDPLRMQELLRSITPQQIDQMAGQLAQQGVPAPPPGSLPQAMEQIRQFQQNPTLGFRGQGPGPTLGAGQASLANNAALARAITPQFASQGGGPTQADQQRLQAAMGALQAAQPRPPQVPNLPGPGGMSAVSPFAGLNLPSFRPQIVPGIGEFL